MSILLLIILGFISGWLASVIMKTDTHQGAVGDILLGIIGAVILIWVGRQMHLG